LNRKKNNYRINKAKNAIQNPKQLEAKHWGFSYYNKDEDLAEQHRVIDASIQSNILISLKDIVKKGFENDGLDYKAIDAELELLEKIPVADFKIIESALEKKLDSLIATVIATGISTIMTPGANIATLPMTITGTLIGSEVSDFISNKIDWGLSEGIAEIMRRNNFETTDQLVDGIESNTISNSSGAIRDIKNWAEKSKLSTKEALTALLVAEKTRNTVVQYSVSKVNPMDDIASINPPSNVMALFKGFGIGLITHSVVDEISDDIRAAKQEKIKQELAEERYPALIKARDSYLEIANNPEKALSRAYKTTPGLDPQSILLAPLYEKHLDLIKERSITKAKEFGDWADYIEKNYPSLT
jgi:hypothetical protein